MNKKELGYNYFKSGYNCAQSVVLAFKDEIGLDEKLIASMAAGFGGGFGRMREVCGAVLGMVMVLGALQGDYDKLDNIKKGEFYKKVQTFINKFKEENGSYVCRELLNLPNVSDSPTPEERTEKYYKKRPCGELVAVACQILEDFLNNDL